MDAGKAQSLWGGPRCLASAHRKILLYPQEGEGGRAGDQRDGGGAVTYVGRAPLKGRLPSAQGLLVSGVFEDLEGARILRMGRCRVRERAEGGRSCRSQPSLPPLPPPHEPEVQEPGRGGLDPTGHGTGTVGADYGAKPKSQSQGAEVQELSESKASSARLRSWRAFMVLLGSDVRLLILLTQPIPMSCSEHVAWGQKGICSLLS